MKYPEDYINKIICGDCLDLMNGIPDKSVDFIFCDYPFNCQDGKSDYIKFIDDTALAFYGKLKENSVLLIVNNPTNIFNTAHSFNVFKQRDNIALIRKGSLRPAWHFGFQHNYLRTFIKGQDTKLKWNGTKINHDKSFLTDVITYQNGFRGKGKAWHPQAMPLPLVKEFIRIFTNEGDVVLDPFMGSGTTAVACQELKRNFIGIEFNKQYCEIAQRRLAQDYLFT